MQVYAEKYVVDQEAFIKDYAEAHAKLSNLEQSVELLFCTFSYGCAYYVTTNLDIMFFHTKFVTFSFSCLHTYVFDLSSNNKTVTY